MDRYTMMKISDKFDDDGIDECDLNLECHTSEDKSDDFKKDYHKKYNDVKTSHREDW